MSVYPSMYQSVTVPGGCQSGKESVSAWRKCRSSLGHVDGGGGTSEAPGPHGTSLPSPPDRLGASGLCQRLWPLQTPIYMTSERENMSQIPRLMRKTRVASLHVTRGRMCGCVKAL